MLGAEDGNRTDAAVVTTMLPAGVMIEVHPRPEEALCDAAQQIPTSEFHDFADEIRAFASLMGRTIG